MPKTAIATIHVCITAAGIISLFSLVPAYSTSKLRIIQQCYETAHLDANAIMEVKTRKQITTNVPALALTLHTSHYTLMEISCIDTVRFALQIRHNCMGCTCRLIIKTYRVIYAHDPIDRSMPRISFTDTVSRKSARIQPQAGSPPTPFTLSHTSLLPITP